MRFLFLVVAGAIGWLWYAARAPAEAPPAPSPQVRRADLTGLGAQVAAATRSAEQVAAATRSAELPTFEDIEDEMDGDEPELEVVDEDPEELDPEAELARLAEEAQLAVFNRPPPADALDLSQHDDHNEVITIQDHAPIIDTTSVSRCAALRVGYTKVIPVPRTFTVLVDGEEVSVVDGLPISSGYTVENVYIVEESDPPAIDQPAIDQPAIDQPTIDQPAIDQPAIDQPAVDIPNNSIEKIEANGGSIY
jgi:hypothetical protein